MNRIDAVQSIFRRYQAFSARGNYVIAMSLYERGKVEAQPTDKKILYVYLFYLLMNSCETVIRLTRILRNIRYEDPLKNLLKDDRQDFSREKLLGIRREIEDCEQDPITFFTKYCTLEVTNADKEKYAIRGILSGIKSALNNILAVDQQDNRILWMVHNRLKHGFAVLNKEERGSVIFYLLANGDPGDKGVRKEVPVELKINDTLAKQWLDTIHALSNTQQNLSHLIGNFRLEGDEEAGE